jgi:hypothetical protein
MVVVMVMVNLPASMTREQFVAHSRITAEHWKENQQLLQKTYLYDPQTRQGGALFLWQDLAAAERGHSDTWRQQMVQFYGSEPIVRYFEAPLAICSSGKLGVIGETA